MGQTALQQISMCRIDFEREAEKERVVHALSRIVARHLSPAAIDALRKPEFMARFDLEMEVALLRIELLAGR